MICEPKAVFIRHGHHLNRWNILKKEKPNMFCRSCGTQVEDNKAFCPNCGTALASNAPAPQNVNPQPQPQPGYNPMPQPQRGGMGLKKIFFFVLLGLMGTAFIFSFIDLFQVGYYSYSILSDEGYRFFSDAIALWVILIVLYTAAIALPTIMFFVKKNVKPLFILPAVVLSALFIGGTLMLDAAFQSALDLSFGGVLFVLLHLGVIGIGGFLMAKPE